MPIEANTVTVNSVADDSPLALTNIASTTALIATISPYSSTPDRALTSSTSLSNAAFPEVSIVLSRSAENVEAEIAVLLLSSPSAPASTAIYAVTAP